MSVRIVASGPRGHKRYDIIWKNGELYDYHDTRAGAVRKAARARREEKEYYSRYSPKKNPSKLQRALMTQKKRTERRVADALAKYLKVQNPGQKITSAKVQRLKGGVIKITPIRSNPSGQYMVQAFHGGGAVFSTRAAADAYAKRLREANRQAGNVGPVKVVKVK